MEREGSCDCCKKWREHFYWNHSKKMRFFKVMNGDISRSMRIPEQFRRKSGGEFSGTVDLRGPGGSKWHVKLMETAGGVYFQHGWEEFIVAHQIKENDLLVFQYDGKFCFDILMFDESGCEKAESYFVRKKNSRREERVEDSVELLDLSHHDEVIECSSSSDFGSDMQQASGPSILHKFSADHETVNQIRRVQSNPSECLPSKRARWRPLVNVSGENVGTSKSTTYQVKKEADEMHLHEKKTLASVCMSMKTKLPNADKKKVLQLLRAVRPENPCFLSIMRRTSVSERFNLTIPREFAVAHLPCRTQGITLQTPNRRKKWGVKCLVNKITLLAGKWRNFVLDNKLEVGDLCVFELVGRQKDISMTVHIFGHQNSSPSSPY